MKFLAFETATDVCSIALEMDDGILSEEFEAAQIHSKVLLPTAKAMLQKAGLDFAGLDGLVVGTGPGGFTSLRIGLASIQGLALAHDLPIYPVSSLLNVASAVSGFDWVWAIMDARMGEVYTQLFEAGPEGRYRAYGDARVTHPASLELPIASGRLAVVGHGLSAYEDVFGELLARSDVTYDADVMPSAVRALRLRGVAIRPWELSADYIRDQVTH